LCLRGEGGKAFSPKQDAHKYMHLLTQDDLNKLPKGSSNWFKTAFNQVQELIVGDYLCMPCEGKEELYMVSHAIVQSEYSQLHTPHHEMLKIYKDVVKRAPMMVRSANVLSRKARNGDEISGSKDGNQWRNEVIGDDYRIIRQWTNNGQSEYQIKETDFRNNWNSDEGEDIKDGLQFGSDRLVQELREEGWKIYSPKQKAFKYMHLVTQDDLKRLPSNSSGWFPTKFGQLHKLKVGDYLCMPRAGQELYMVSHAIVWTNYDGCNK